MIYNDIYEDAKALIKAHDEWSFASAEMARPGAWDGKYEWAQEIVRLNKLVDAFQLATPVCDSQGNSHRVTPKHLELCVQEYEYQIRALTAQRNKVAEDVTFFKEELVWEKEMKTALMESQERLANTIRQLKSMLGRACDLAVRSNITKDEAVRVHNERVQKLREEGEGL